MLGSPVKSLREVLRAEHSVTGLLDTQPLNMRVEPQKFLGIRTGDQLVEPCVDRQHIGAVPDIGVPHFVQFQQHAVEFIRNIQLPAHFNVESALLCSVKREFRLKQPHAPYQRIRHVDRRDPQRHLPERISVKLHSL